MRKVGRKVYGREKVELRRKVYGRGIGKVEWKEYGREMEEQGRRKGKV